MSKISRSSRCWFALGVWGVGIVIFLVLAWWNLQTTRRDDENRLIGEAGRVAAQMAGLLSYPGSKLDVSSARAIVNAALEDERVYAVKVEAHNRLLAGERRNYLWEPIAWDDEIAENCVLGMNPIRVGGKIAGKIEVWISPRSNAEEEALLLYRERLRFIVLAFLWTLVLCLLLWYWGDFRRFSKLWEVSSQKDTGGENIVLGLGKQPAQKEEKKSDACLYVNAAQGREYQRKHPGAWLVTAGLFRQTFLHAPALLGRLYSDNEIAGLCHLGHMLELAAPCLGAEPLLQAAKKMQAALNDPGCEACATDIESCAQILEKTLAALASDVSGAPINLKDK